jgi:hypothetical protein
MISWSASGSVTRATLRSLRGFFSAGGSVATGPASFGGGSLGAGSDDSASCDGSLGSLGSRGTASPRSLPGHSEPSSSGTSTTSPVSRSRMRTIQLFARISSMI